MYQMLQDIYIKYGYSKEKGISVVRKGKSGAEEIVAMMKNFRENPMKELGGSPVILIKDYASLEATDMVNGTKSKLDMPVTSNVLQYFSADGSKVSIRPSGTEPKSNSISKCVVSRWITMPITMQPMQRPMLKSKRLKKSWVFNRF